MGDGDEEAILVSCVRSSLQLAGAHGLRSLAFPAVSTGIYGVPLELAARALVGEARRYLAESSTGVEHVLFCLFAPRDLAAFEQALGQLAQE
jgi:O-acetyl-ADP-ribose deacetylase (regulator of RNase III)